MIWRWLRYLIPHFKSSRRMVFHSNTIGLFFNPYFGRYSHHIKMFTALNVLTWLGFTKEDAYQDSELITILKRAVICTQRGEFDKAELILHAALRVAQQLQSQQGILYCYDLMANVALNKLELLKAEKLFVSILQRLLSQGVPQHDLKVVHISLKLARIAQLQHDYDRAQLGFDWCLSQLKDRKDQNDDILLLYGVVNDWYAQFLLDQGRVQMSKAHLLEAYNACKALENNPNEQSAVLLNDLATICFRTGDINEAHEFLKHALDICKRLDPSGYTAVIYANLGLILLQKGITEEAQRNCKKSLSLAKKYDSEEGLEQAKYCMEQIKMFMTQPKQQQL